MAPPAKPPIYVKWARRVYTSIHDFLKYRVRMSTRNVLVIGGASPVGQSVVDAFRGNWRVVNLDHETNPLVQDNILWQCDDPLGHVNHSVQCLNIKFDSIIFVPRQTNQPVSSLAQRFLQDRDAMLVPAVVAAQLAQKHTANNSILIMLGCQDSFDKTIDQTIQMEHNLNTSDDHSTPDSPDDHSTPDSPDDHSTPSPDDYQSTLLSYSSMMNSIHMVGVNLNADDDNMPTDLTITTALNRYPNRDTPCRPQQAHEQAQLASVLRLWSDGYRRPHSNSIARFEVNQHGRLFWQFV